MDTAEETTGKRRMPLDSLDIAYLGAVAPTHDCALALQHICEDSQVPCPPEMHWAQARAPHLCGLACTGRPEQPIHNSALWLLPCYAAQRRVRNGPPPFYAQPAVEEGDTGRVDMPSYLTADGEWCLFYAHTWTAGPQPLGDPQARPGDPRPPVFSYARVEWRVREREAKELGDRYLGTSGVLDAALEHRDRREERLRWVRLSHHHRDALAVESPQHNYQEYGLALQGCRGDLPAHRDLVQLQLEAALALSQATEEWRQVTDPTAPNPEAKAKLGYLGERLAELKHIDGSAARWRDGAWLDGCLGDSLVSRASGPPDGPQGYLPPAARGVQRAGKRCQLHNENSLLCDVPYEWQCNKWARHQGGLVEAPDRRTADYQMFKMEEAKAEARMALADTLWKQRQGERLPQKSGEAGGEEERVFPAYRCYKAVYVNGLLHKVCRITHIRGPTERSRLCDLGAYTQFDPDGLCPDRTWQYEGEAHRLHRVIPHNDVGWLRQGLVVCDPCAQLVRTTPRVREECGRVGSLLRGHGGEVADSLLSQLLHLRRTLRETWAAHQHLRDLLAGEPFLVGLPHDTLALVPHLCAPATTPCSAAGVDPGRREEKKRMTVASPVGTLEVVERQPSDDRQGDEAGDQDAAGEGQQPSGDPEDDADEDDDDDEGCGPGQPTWDHQYEQFNFVRLTKRSEGSKRGPLVPSRPTYSDDGGCTFYTNAEERAFLKEERDKKSSAAVASVNADPAAPQPPADWDEERGDRVRALHAAVVAQGKDEWPLGVNYLLGLLSYWACLKRSGAESRELEAIMAKAAKMLGEERFAHHLGDGDKAGDAWDEEGDLLLVRGLLSRAEKLTAYLFGPGGRSDGTVGCYCAYMRALSERGVLDSDRDVEPMRSWLAHGRRLDHALRLGIPPPYAAEGCTVTVLGGGQATEEEGEEEAEVAVAPHEAAGLPEYPPPHCEMSREVKESLEADLELSTSLTGLPWYQRSYSPLSSDDEESKGKDADEQEEREGQGEPSATAHDPGVVSERLALGRLRSRSMGTPQEQAGRPTQGRRRLVTSADSSAASSPSGSDGEATGVEEEEQGTLATTHGE